MVSEKLLNNRVRFILLASSVLLFTGAGVLLANSYYWYAIALLISGLIIIMIINRIYNAANESIITFFDSLRNDDTAVHFSTDINNRTLTGLYESMNNLNNHFQEIKIKNEYNESYYRTLIQHASTGLLVIDSNNRIELINKAACSYAGISAESTNTNLLKIRHPAFYEAVCKLKPGENVIYRNLNSGDLQLLFFRASVIRRKDAELKLVSIQDIRNELESRELESYRKLISVMTHEIMNLLSPLTSVSRELYSLFRKDNKFIGLKELDDSDIKTAVNGLQLINDQSKGLMSFVNNYRRLSKIPQPEFTAFQADEWAEQLKIAFSGRMTENNIDFLVIADKSCRQIIADKNLLNQVMINLINNAFDAVMEIEGERKIEIQLLKNIHDRYVIKVINNGPVIEPELLEKIFVPFFTTKKNGSGIGLSISQEIMKRHNGSVIAISTGEALTCFVVEF
jgi:two-component system nitrogen regulation sensor histidine kinase NtrY